MFRNLRVCSTATTGLTLRPPQLSSIRKFTVSPQKMSPPKGKKKDDESPPEFGSVEDEAHQFQASDRTDREIDQWKLREPYAIHDKKSNFDAKWKGHCHCGRIKYELSRKKPLASKYCHCMTCQRLHAAPFQWAAIFHKSDINFTTGHHDLGWYDPSNKSLNHHLPCKVFCSYCRTPIMDEGRNMILMFPNLIEGIDTKEARDAFKPTCHMFYLSRSLGFKGDGLVKWKGLDNGSDLLDDDGNVIEEFKEGMDSKEMNKRKRRKLDMDENNKDEVPSMKSGKETQHEQ